MWGTPPGSRPFARACPELVEGLRAGAGASPFWTPFFQHLLANGTTLHVCYLHRRRYHVGCPRFMLASGLLGRIVSRLEPGSLRRGSVH